MPFRPPMFLLIAGVGLAFAGGPLAGVQSSAASGPPAPDPLGASLAASDSLWSVELDAARSGDFARAAQVLDPDSPRAAAAVARSSFALAILNRRDEARWREHLERTIRIAEEAPPGDPADGSPDAADWALRARGELSLWTGAREAARIAEFLFDETERRLARDSTDALAHGVLGRVHHEIMSLSRVERFLARTLSGADALGRASWEDAGRHLAAAVRHAPDDRQARMSFARYLSRQERTAEAAEQLRLAWALPDRAPHDRMLRVELCDLLRDLLSWAPDGEPLPSACSETESPPGGTRNPQGE